MQQTGSHFSRFLLSGLLALLAAATAVDAADQPDVAPPREPLLPRMPANSEWTVKLTTSNDDAGRLALAEPKKGSDTAAPQPAGSYFLDALTITKVNPTTYREISKWSDGNSREKWVVDRLPIQKMSPPHNRLVQATSFTQADYSSYEISDFPELEWIGKDNYVGPKIVAGRPVYVFSTENKKRRLNQKENLLVAEQLWPFNLEKRSIAYLDAQTQRPVFVDDGTTARVYSYAEAPSGNVAIPDDFAAMFARWKKSLGR